MPSPRVLIIDDDDTIRAVLRRYLGAHGFRVSAADRGSDGLLLMKEAVPDLVLADAHLPDLDGEAVCRVVRRGGLAPRIPFVLMSGVRRRDADISAALEDGVDDFLVKPFSLRVLSARLKAVLRRCSRLRPARPAVASGELEISAESRTVGVAGRAVELTRKEFDLLCALVANAGRVVGVRSLRWAVGSHGGSKAVESHVFNLRRKLGSRAATRIATFPGRGYRFD